MRTPVKTSVQSKPASLPATPQLPTFGYANVLDSPGKLTASTRSTAALTASTRSTAVLYTPSRAGYSSLNSSVISYLEPESDPVVALDVRSWDQAGVRPSVQNRVGSPHRNPPSKNSSPRKSPRSSSPPSPIPPSPPFGVSSPRLANRSTSPQSQRSSARSSPRPSPKASPKLSARTILQSTGGPLTKPAQAPATFDQPRKSVAAKLPPRAQSCSHSRSPSPRRKCEACCHCPEERAYRPGYLHGQVIEPFQRSIQGNRYAAYPSQMIAGRGAYGQMSGVHADTNYANNHGIAHAELPMEASDLDRHIHDCENARAAVAESTTWTLDDVQKHANHSRDIGVRSSSQRRVSTTDWQRRLKTGPMDEDTDVWSRRSTDSAASDRDNDDSWTCCRDNCKTSRRSVVKGKNTKEGSYGVAIKL